MRGLPAVFWAITYGHLKMLKYLLTCSGQDINQIHPNGSTILGCAAWNGHLHIIKYLIEERGIDVNQSDSSQATPLHYAACFGYSHIVQYLILKGATIKQEYIDAAVNNCATPQNQNAVERYTKTINALKLGMKMAEAKAKMAEVSSEKTETGDPEHINKAPKMI